jgi:hypothetical protein
MTFLDDLIKNEETVKMFANEYYANIGRKEINSKANNKEIPFAYRFGGCINEKPCKKY